MKTKQLCNRSLVDRLEKVQYTLSDYAQSHWNETLGDYDTSLATDASSVVGAIEQFIETYYFLSNHGVK